MTIDECYIIEFRTHGQYMNTWTYWISGQSMCKFIVKFSGLKFLWTKTSNYISCDYIFILLDIRIELILN